MSDFANSPWVVRDSGFVEIPPGFYTTKFLGCENHTLKTGEVRWRWRWHITTGAYSGKDATALTSQDISPKTHAGRLIAGLLSRAIQPGENVAQAVTDCAGKAYMVNVQAGSKGGRPSVQNVSLPPDM